MKKIQAILLGSAIVVLAGLGALIFVKTALKAKRVRPPRIAEPVRVRPISRSDETVALRLAGIVRPAERITLKAQVAGEIVGVSTNFIDGGLAKKGDALLRIDPADYRLALARAESALETARFNLKTELGRQKVAQREWELLKTPDASVAERELALRKPHLAAAKATLAAAEAQLEKARLDLARTEIRAPFNALVLSRRADVGALASPQAPLAELAGTDAYWIQVAIPLDRLNRLDVSGAPAVIRTERGACRTGRAIRVLGDLSPRGRMARILVEVRDPLCRKQENADKTPLLIGEFVRVELSGHVLSDVFRIPRNALRENDELWLVEDGKLRIVRNVEIPWRDAESAFVRAPIDDGSQLIVSDVVAPVPGMDVRIVVDRDASPSAPGPDDEGKRADDVLEEEKYKGTT